MRSIPWGHSCWKQREEGAQVHGLDGAILALGAAKPVEQLLTFLSISAIPPLDQKLFVDENNHCGKCHLDPTQ